MKLYISKKIVMYSFIYFLGILLVIYNILTPEEEISVLERMGFILLIGILFTLPTISNRTYNYLKLTIEIRNEHEKCIMQLKNKEFAKATMTIDAIIDKYEQSLNYKYRMKLYHDASMAYMLMGDFYTSELRLKKSMIYGVNINSKVLKALLHYELDGDLRYAVEIYQVLKRNSRNSPFVDFLEDIIFENT